MSAHERAAVDVAVSALLSTGPYIGGPAVSTFEDELAAYVGVAHGVGVDNGSNALTIALQALGLTRGGVILVPPNDGGFAAAATQAAGLVPGVVDVDAETGLVTADTLSASDTEGVVGVIVTHLHGILADMVPILEWCGSRGLAVVEDCAQAHGARRGGTMAGAFGDVAAFSFYPTKNLGALGDAGALVTDRPGVADRARLLRQYGWSSRFRVSDDQGRNSRLDSVQAAVLSARLPFLDTNNGRRREVGRRYRTAAPALDMLGPEDDSNVVHHAVARTRQRDGLWAHLVAAGVGVDLHYPYLVQEMPGIVLASKVATPNADVVRRECLSLPCFPGITDAEIDVVCGALREWSPQ